MSNIVIKNLSGSSSHNIGTPPYMPDLPFTMAVSGCSRSGKSCFIINLLRRREMLKPYFEEKSIFIFSPSIHLNDDFDFLKDAYKFEGFDESIMREIITKQQRVIKDFGKKRTKHILMIFDDCYDNKHFNRSNVLTELAFRGRHSLISTIMSGQKLSSIPRGVRLNLTNMYIFRPTNLSELQFLSDEFIDKKNRAEFVEILKEVWLKPYNFITLDLLNHDITMRIREGLHNPIGTDFYLPKGYPKKKLEEK